VSYKTALEVAGYLVEAGLLDQVPPDESEIADLLASTIAEWDKQTGWAPYFRASQDMTNISFWYNRGQSVYPLPTKVESMTEPKVATATVTGDLEFGLHWRWLNPSRRSEVEMLTTLTDAEQVTLFDVLTTKVLTVPDDVNAAILAGCAAKFCDDHPDLAANLISQRLGEIQVERDAGEGSAVEQWRKRWARAVRQHRRGQVIY
jgi:hypothetical protein